MSEEVSRMAANQAVLDALYFIGSPSTAVDIAKVADLQISTVYAACRRMARRGWMAETKVAGNRSVWTLTRKWSE